MTAILVVAAPRKALRHGTWTTAPESRYTVGWYDAIGWLQMRQALTRTWVIDGPLASNPLRPLPIADAPLENTHGLISQRAGKAQGLARLNCHDVSLRAIDRPAYWTFV